MATKRKKKKLTRREIRKRRRRRFLIAEVLLLFVLVAGLFVWMKFGMINFDDISNVKKNKLDSETEQMLTGYTTIALFGVDNRSNGNYESGNSDSIIVAVINNDTKEVRLMSVLRDTYLDVGDGTHRKCNYAFNHGGVEQAIGMLNSNLDLDIQDYVAVDFYAVVEAVDALGGIQLDISDEEAPIMNTSYMGEIQEVTGISSEPAVAGKNQTVNGVQALAYARIRYTEGDDFVRAKRHRIVISAIVDKLKKSNIMELNKFINAVFPDISTSFTASELLSMAKAYKDYELGQNGNFPFDLHATNYGSKGDVDVPCTLETNVQKAYEFLYDDSTHVCSQECKNISDEIQYETGYGVEDAEEYKLNN